MKICCLMQGPSGSGKSTLAKHIAYVIDAEIFSTDEIFVENGVYNFDPKKLGIYHKRNQERVAKALAAGGNVIVDNTNLRRWEAKPYVLAALANGYEVKFVRATGNFQNIHGVPDAKVEQMKAAMEDLTLESVLAVQ